MNKLTLTIASNTIYQFLTRFISSITVLLITIIVVRTSGVELFGQYSVVISYISLWLIFIDFGFNPIIVKRIANKPKILSSEYSNALFFRMYLSLLVMFISGIILLLLPYSIEIKYAILISIPIIFLTSVIRSTLIIFQFLNTYWKSLLATIIGVLFNIVIISYIILYGSITLNDLVIAYLIGILIISFISFLFTTKFYKFKSRIDKDYLKKIVIPAIPIGLVLVFNLLMIQIDRFILSIFDTPVSVGIYTLSYKIFEFVLVIPVFVMNSAYPILLIHRKSNYKQYNRLYKKIIAFLAIISLSVLIFIPFTSDLITLLWGSEMILSSSVLNILLLGTVFFFISAPLSWKLIVENNQKDLIFVYGIGLLINLFLNLIFIPEYGVYAAAINTIISEIVVLGILIKYNFNKI